MSFDNVSHNINSAIVSASFGLQRASSNITQASFNIAQRTAESLSPQDAHTCLAYAASQQLGKIKQVLPQRSPGLTANLLGLSANNITALASAKVLGAASGTGCHLAGYLA
jgi:putative effector of murein hydrolase